MSYDKQELWRLLAQAIGGAPTDLHGHEDAVLLRHVARHGIGPLLHQRLRQDIVKGLSDTVRNRLATGAQSQAALDLLLNDSTHSFAGLLHENGIPALLLKGTPVAHLFYPETWLRPRCDTDVFIGEADRVRAMELLRANGYQISGQLDRRYSSKQFVASIKTFQQTFTSFDVHWKLSNRVLFQSTLPFEECLERRQPVPALGGHAWTLSTVDLLLHACVHRIAHGRNTERNRLLWLYDIHLLWAALDEAGQDCFVDKALDRQVGALCADALQITEELFGKPEGRDAGAAGAVSAGKEILKDLRRNRRREPTASLVDAGKLRWVLADWWAVARARAKAEYAREVLFDR